MFHYMLYLLFVQSLFISFLLTPEHMLVLLTYVTPSRCSHTFESPIWLMGSRFLSQLFFIPHYLALLTCTY